MPSTATRATVLSELDAKTLRKFEIWITFPEADIAFILESGASTSGLDADRDTEVNVAGVLIIDSVATDDGPAFNRFAA